MNLDTKALIGFVKEIEDSRTRQKGETEFQRDVFKRARGKHFDVKALRIVLQRRAMEPTKRDEQDYTVHAYELALGAKKLAVEAMERGATAREAARKHNLPRAAVTALKPEEETGSKNTFVEPCDPETGEMTEVDVSGDDAGHRSEPSSPAEQSVNADPPPGSDGPSIETAKGSNPASIPEATDDGMDILPFLRRTKEAVT